VQTDVSWLPRGMRVRAGEETLGQPLQQGGKRRSRPLPTKATREDVDECGSEPSSAKEIWQGWECAFNVWRLARVNAVMRLLNQDVHSADAAQDDDAPSRRVFVGAAELGGWSGMTV
jgi:hypothetical protein